MDEYAINEMSIPFFDDVLEELGHKLAYDAIVNYAGNSFCEKSWDMIQESNPFTVAEQASLGSSRMANKLAGFFANANIPVVKSEGKSYSERLKEQKENILNGKEKADAGDVG